MLPETNVVQSLRKSRLWKNIQHFKFDADDAVITFAGKLAAQKEWSVRFTESVIEEYRRFIFLCCISPTGASPSQMVDEVWHQHLTYTQSYWVDLCKHTLGKDLHHHPTKGGEEENKKHRNWYKETLSLYVQVFEAVPPPDIWPPPPEALDYRSMSAPLSTVSNIIIKAVFFCAIILSMVAVAFAYFPFNLDGPEFLVFFGLLSTVVAMLVNSINASQLKKIESFIQSQFPDDVNIFQLSLFMNRTKGLIEISILDLVRKGLLTIEEDGHFTVNNKTRLAIEQNPYAESLYKEVDEKKLTYKEIKSTWRINGNYSHPVLDRIQAVLALTHFHRGYLPAAVLIIGFIRIIQGIINDQPVILLIIEMLIFSTVVVFNIILFSQYKLTYLLEKTVYAMYCEKLETSGQVHDKVITEYARRGKPALTGFADGMLLSSVFFISKPAIGSDGSGGSESGSGGGCGSSGGSGCGGGCGGCGGG